METVFVAGGKRGGVGRTTVTRLLIEHFMREKMPQLIVVDCDPNGGIVRSCLNDDGELKEGISACHEINLIDDNASGWGELLELIDVKKDEQGVILIDSHAGAHTDTVRYGTSFSTIQNFRFLFVYEDDPACSMGLYELITATDAPVCVIKNARFGSTAFETFRDFNRIVRSVQILKCPVPFLDSINWNHLLYSEISDPTKMIPSIRGMGEEWLTQSLDAVRKAVGIAAEVPDDRIDFVEKNILKEREQKGTLD